MKPGGALRPKPQVDHPIQWPRNQNHWRQLMAAFKSVDAAVDYALALQGNTDHLQIRIRAGIHIGPMHVEEGDVFGGTVNFAARVVGAVKGAEIWLSDRAK